MADDELIVARVKMDGSQKFQREADKNSHAVKGIGRSANTASTSMGRMNTASGSLMGGLRRLTTVAKIAAVVGIAALTVGIGASIKAFGEAETVAVDQAAALKSTGANAWITAKQLDQMAYSQAMRTGMDDEAIASAQTLLLTFTKVRNAAGKNNDVFNQANAIIGDFSVRFKKDLAGSAIIVGKALNDPVKGVAALGRVGVQFTEVQKNQIERLVEGNNLLGAQKIVMKELRVQTEGAAEAYGKTFNGSIDRAKVVVGNLAESIGEKLAPSIKRGVEWVRLFVLEFESLRNEGLSYVSATREALAGMLGPNHPVARGFDALRETANVALDVIENLGGAAKNVGGIIGDELGGKSGDAGDSIRKLGEWIVIGTEKIEDFTAWLRKGSDGAEFLKGAIVGIATAIVAYKVIMLIQGIAGALSLIAANPVVLVIAAIIGIGVALVIAYKRVKWFRDAVNTAISFVRDHWRWIIIGMLGPIGFLVVAIVNKWDKITRGFQTATTKIRELWKAVVEKFGPSARRVAAAVNEAWPKIQEGFGKMVDWISDKWNKFAKPFNATIGTINDTTGLGLDDLGIIGGGTSGITAGAAIEVGSNFSDRVAEQFENRSSRGRKSTRGSFAKPITSPFAARLATAGAGGSTVIENVIMLDGREVHRSVVRGEQKKANRR